MSRSARRMQRAINQPALGSGYLGSIGIPAFRACSLRRLSSVYTGAAIRVRRSSDNAELDVGFSGDDLNTTSLLAFAGSSSLFVKTWYDQSGYNRHLTQSVAASQARIVFAGTLETLSGKPTVVFDGVDDYYSDSVVGLCAAGGASASVILSAPEPPSGTNMHVLNESKPGVPNGNSSYRMVRTSTSGSMMFQMTNDSGTSLIASAAGILFDDTPHILYVSDTGSTVTSFIDGIQAHNAAYSRIATTTPTNFTVGATVQSTVFWYYAGSISEFIVWTAPLTSLQRQAGEADQETYLASTEEGGTAPLAGAVSLGLANYTAPGGAIYASPTGSNSNPGTLASPKLTALAAINAAPSGGTVVLRGGVYVENLGEVTKIVTIQNHPGEAVWFDGTSPTTGWVANGNGTWRKTGMSGAAFDHSGPPNTDAELNRYRDAQTEPLFHYPEMVWIDGVRQKRTEGTPVSGEFNWDHATSTITIHGDPTDKEVRVSSQSKFLVSKAAMTIRGIGIRRYATGLAQAGALNIVMAGAGTTLENCHILQNGLQALCPSSLNVTIQNCTVADNGSCGIGGDNSQDLLIANCLIERNNVKRLRPQPISANVKLTRTQRVLVKDNIVADAWRCNGLWWDMDCIDTTVVGNVIDGAEDYGIEIEISARCIIAGNWILGRGGRTKYGIALYNSGGDKNNVGFARVYNNWIEECSGWDGPMTHDERRQSTASVCDFRARLIEHCNNVHAKRSTMYRLYAVGNGNDVFANTAMTKVYGNVVTSSDTGGTTSSRLAGWTDSSQTRINYSTVAALQSAKSQVQRTRMTAIVSPTQADLESWKNDAEPLPQNVADALGLPLGTKVLGPPNLQPVRVAGGGSTGGGSTGPVLDAPVVTAFMSGTTLNASWTAVDEAIGYIWEYKTASSSTWTEMGVIYALSTTVTGLQSGTQYDVRVSALNSQYSQGFPGTARTP